MPSGAVNNVNVLPDGSTTFQEVDIPAGDAFSPPNTSRIRWIKTASGAVVAEEYAYDSLGTGQGALQIFAHGSGPAGGTGAVLVTADHTTGRAAELRVQAGSGDLDPNQSKVVARAASTATDNFVLLIDGLGQSDVMPAGLATGTFVGPWNAATVGSGIAFNITQKGSYLLVAYCSAYATIANQDIGVGLYIDNVGKGFMRSFTNEALSHKVMVPLAVVMNFNKGSHTVEFAHVAATFPNCTSNNGDFGQMIVVRVGP